MGCSHGVTGCRRYMGQGQVHSLEPLRDAVSSAWVGALTLG